MPKFLKKNIHNSRNKKKYKQKKTINKKYNINKIGGNGGNVGGNNKIFSPTTITLTSTSGSNNLEFANKMAKFLSGGGGNAGNLYNIPTFADGGNHEQVGTVNNVTANLTRAYMKQTVGAEYDNKAFTGGKSKKNKSKKNKSKKNKSKKNKSKKK